MRCTGAGPVARCLPVHLMGARSIDGHPAAIRRRVARNTRHSRRHCSAGMDALDGAANRTLPVVALAAGRSDGRSHWSHRAVGSRRSVRRRRPSVGRCGTPSTSLRPCSWLVVSGAGAFRARLSSFTVRHRPVARGFPGRPRARAVRFENSQFVNCSTTDSYFSCNFISFQFRNTILFTEKLVFQ